MMQCVEKAQLVCLAAYNSLHFLTTSSNSRLHRYSLDTRKIVKLKTINYASEVTVNDVLIAIKKMKLKKCPEFGYYLIC